MFSNIPLLPSPHKEKISFTHEDMVSDLNFLLNDKAKLVNAW